MLIQLVDDDGVCLDMCDFQEEIENARREFPRDDEDTHRKLARVAMTEAAADMIRNFCS